MVVHIVVHYNEGLSEKRSYFSSADVEGVYKVGDVRQLQVVFRPCESCSKTSAVHVEIETVLSAAFTESRQLCFGIDSAVFRRVGYVCHFRDYGMLVLMVKEHLFDGFRSQFAIFRRSGKNSVTGGLN